MIGGGGVDDALCCGLLTIGEGGVDGGLLLISGRGGRMEEVLVDVVSFRGGRVDGTLCCGLLMIGVGGVDDELCSGRMEEILVDGAL